MPFGDGDTRLQHIARQQSFRLRYTVLDVDGRHVGIGALLEIHHDRYVTRRGSRSGHVGHVLYTVDLLLQRLDHGFHTGVRVRTRVGGSHLYGRRCDIRILLHRQTVETDKSDQHNDNRNRDCHHVFIDENILHIRKSPFVLPPSYLLLRSQSRRLLPDRLSRSGRAPS